MRLIVCLLPLLSGCAAPAVRCDAHLQAINPPAPVAGAGASTGAASATAAVPTAGISTASVSTAVTPAAAPRRAP